MARSTTSPKSRKRGSSVVTNGADTGQGSYGQSAPADIQRPTDGARAYQESDKSGDAGTKGKSNHGSGRRDPDRRKGLSRRDGT